MSHSRKEATSVEFAERRTLERTYEEMDGIYTPENGSPVPCKILDFSMMGARVSFDESRVLPGEVSIQVPKIGLQYVGEVRWRRSNEAGLLFKSAVPIPED